MFFCKFSLRLVVLIKIPGMGTQFKNVFFFFLNARKNYLPRSTNACGASRDIQSPTLAYQLNRHCTRRY